MSLQYLLTQACIDNPATINNNTLKSDKANCRRFANWCKENGYNKLSKIHTAGKEHVLQSYCNYLVNRHLSPATIHTYLSSPCKALGVSMSKIDKPKRTSQSITRSRDLYKNQTGKRQCVNSYYERLINFQKVVGLRRSELSKLKGSNLVYDESGKLCVEVLRGKGGKYQLQRILPQGISIVQDTFKNILPDEFVFSSTEMKNKIDLHALRAKQARTAYFFYANMDKQKRYELIKELVARYLRFHNNDMVKCKKWLTELTKGNGKYILRGGNYDRAMCNGCPVEYDRLALMATSVFHLSHWRLNVTVINYML